MKLEIVQTDDVPATEGHVMGHPVSGRATSRRVSPDDYPLWLALVELEAGAALSWPEAHGDEGVYVREGELDVAGASCPAGGAVIVEGGASCTAVATRPTTVIHCGPSEPTDDGAGSGAVHVVGPEGRWVTSRGDVITAHWFADGTCPTCRIQLFRVRHTAQGVEQRGTAHSHSQDEIIHVLEGSMRLGNHECGPGSSLCIPADVRYAVTGSPGGHTFLNFRRAVSFLTAERDAPPAEETALAQGGSESGGPRRVPPPPPS